jgi:hypothetical protein
MLVGTLRLLAIAVFEKEAVTKFEGRRSAQGRGYSLRFERRRNRRRRVKGEAVFKRLN